MINGQGVHGGQQRPLIVLWGTDVITYYFSGSPGLLQLGYRYRPTGQLSSHALQYLIGKGGLSVLARAFGAEASALSTSI